MTRPAEGLGAGIVERVGGAAGRKADESAWADLVLRFAQRQNRGPFEDVDALVLVVMNVRLRRVGAGGDLDQMNPEPGQSGRIAQRPVRPARVRVEEMHLRRAGHRLQVGGRSTS